jgi:hypothetical protein
MRSRVDLAAAAALVGLSQVEVWSIGAGSAHAVAAPTQALTGAAVCFRRRAPLVGVVLTVGATTVDGLVTGTSVSLTAIVAWFVLFATAGASADRLTRFGALSVGVAGSAAMSGGNSSPLLFPGERGGYLDIHHFSPYQWRPAQKAVGLKR